jgi:formylglycine-generating enzyme required for sulfatase activity
VADLERITNELGMKFVKIPAGTFLMGDGEPIAKHQVTLTQPFYLQVTEVTQEEWESVMGSNPSAFSGCPTCPVEGISWEEVQGYVSALEEVSTGSYRLPTEAEWEYATRAGLDSLHFFGEYDPGELERYAWCHETQTNPGLDFLTHPVAQKLPNQWGLYDVLGNVYEWVQDWSDWSYYSEEPKTDPQGPESGVNGRKAWRGRYCETTYPGGTEAWRGDNKLGFRLVWQP